MEQTAPEPGEPEARGDSGKMGLVAAGAAAALCGLNAAGLSLAESDASLTTMYAAVAVGAAAIFVLGLRLRSARVRLTLHAVLSVALVVAACDVYLERDENLHLGWFLFSTLAPLPFSAAAAVKAGSAVAVGRPFDVWRSAAAPAAVVLASAFVLLGLAFGDDAEDALEADVRARVGAAESVACSEISSHSFLCDVTTATATATCFVATTADGAIQHVTAFDEEGEAVLCREVAVG
jgi:hypothetical protein